MEVDSVRELHDLGKDLTYFNPEINQFRSYFYIFSPAQKKNPLCSPGLYTGRSFQTAGGIRSGIT